MTALSPAHAPAPARGLAPAYLPSLSTLWMPSFPLIERHVPPDSHLNWLVRLARLVWVIALLPLHALLVLLHAASPVPPPTSWVPGASRRWTTTQRLLYPPVGRALWAITGIGRCPDVGDRWEYDVPLSTRVSLHHLVGGRASVEAEVIELSGAARREAWVRGEAADPAGVVLSRPVPCFWIEAKDTPTTAREGASGGAVASEVPPFGSADARRRTRGGKVVMFLAGGGHVTGHPAEGGRCFSLALDANVTVFGVNYRKATHPSRAFPGALLDALAGYSHLVELGFDTIILAGDSAGGGLCATLLLYLTNTLARAPRGPPPSLVLPAGCVLYSPWVDVSLSTSCSPHNTAGADDILNPSMMACGARHYLSHLGALHPDLLAKQPAHSPAHLLSRHPFISPALPSALEALQTLALAYSTERPFKWLVLSGSAEMLAPEIRAFVANLRRAAHAGSAAEDGSKSMEVEFIEEKDETHCYFLWPSLVSPGAGRALERAGAFVRGM